MKVLRFAALAALGTAVGSCSAAAGDDAATSSAAQRGEPVSTDPIAHLAVIAGPGTDGRGTPSVGLDRAADYVIAECTRAGLVGAMEGGAFRQPFVLAGFASAPAAPPAASPSAPAEPEEHVGAELFENGVLVSGNASEATRAEMAERSDGALFAEHQTASNVVAILPGSGPHRDEVVLFSAHLDHLGAGFPGADDNGSGSAALLAIAARLASTRTAAPLDRTVAFLWTAGEEKGLLGSAFFVDNAPATLPLASLVQVINLDAVGALDDARFSILPDASARTRATTSTLIEASRAMSPPFTRVNRDVQAYARRTDAYSFVRRGIPTIWVFEGLTNPNGGGTLMPRYHRATDTLENLLADNGGAKLRRMTTLLTTTATALANGAAPAPAH